MFRPSTMRGVIVMRRLRDPDRNYCTCCKNSVNTLENIHRCQECTYRSINPTIPSIITILVCQLSGNCIELKNASR